MANKWCTEGVELLASQQIERCQASEFVVEALRIRELDEFLASSDHGRLGSSRQLKTIFEDVITPETKGLVHQVLKRIEDVQMMCEKRKSSLKKLATRLPRPRPDQNLPFLSINLFRANPLLPPPLPAIHTLTLHLHSMLISPSHLRMSQVGLTESVRGNKGDIRKFEVWLQGRQEVHTILAPSAEVKETWVKEIKWVLLDQLEYCT
ncbi:hypothetical protein Pmani_035102 [Petrolisthes manimaculis]|uniref:PH domain-containing protein n=1 Tax=Petrolisthes manimaculis TaxID=1843537 RepID=A0AAE1NLA5_9EUCA|nr:hypothetical protein Pmani_035102 [Petrolisthes manimaculis]